MRRWLHRGVEKCYQTMRVLYASVIAFVLPALLILLMLRGVAIGQQVPVVSVEGQPLAANAKRLADALEYLGYPLDADTGGALRQAIRAESSSRAATAHSPTSCHLFATWRLCVLALNFFSFRASSAGRRREIG